MQDRPTAIELLEVVREFFEAEILPTLEGRQRFHGLVAANVLAIVARELALEETQLEAQRERLEALLGVAPASEPCPGLAALRQRVRALEEALAERIRHGDADCGPFADAVRAHVRSTVVEKLAVANPRWTSVG